MPNPLTLGVTGAAAAAWSAPALAPLVPSVARALRIRTRIDAPGAVALTFDDGPHPQGTPAVLDALARAGAVATFFVVGEQVERRPALVAEILAAGHAVELHGHRHRNMLRVPPRELARDLDRGAALVADTTGRPPRLHRAPLGIYSPAGLAIVRRRGWTPTLWSRWGRDWRRAATAAAIAADASERIEGGDVVLLHDADYYSSRDSWRRTVAALPLILEAITARGLRTVVL